jgi:hypothetical protein
LIIAAFLGFTFAAGENGTATGPVVISTGISLIISTGARVSIV